MSQYTGEGIDAKAAAFEAAEGLPPIERMMRAGLEDMETLHSALSGLEDRMQAVLGPDEPSDTLDRGAVLEAAVGSPLHSKLAELHVAASQAIERVHKLHRRLEV